MIKLWTEVPRDDSAIAKWIKNIYNDIRVPGTYKKKYEEKNVGALSLDRLSRMNI